MFAKKKKKTEKTQETVKKKDLQAHLNALSMRLYRVLRNRFPGAFVKNEADVRKALSVLPNEKKMTVADHYAEKTGLVLLVLVAGVFLTLASHRMATSENAVDANGDLARGTYGKAAVTTTLEAKTAEGEAIGAFDIEVQSVRYTKEEADALFQEASAVLPELILNGNESLHKITMPLSLVKSIPGYPFRIEWQSANYARLRTDGTLVQDALGPGGEAVRLTAHYIYGDDEWEQEMEVLVRPLPETREQRAYRDLQKELQQAEEDTVYEESLHLPETFQGTEVVWQSKEPDPAPVFALLSVITAAGVWFSRGEDLKKRVKEREDALADEYAGFVSKLALYMSAGMTVRAVFLKLGDDYEKNRRAGACPVSFLMEEIKRVANELKSGMSENASYEHFAARCDLQEYAKLMSMLTQNLKKGSAGLLPMMREEVRLSVEGRMDRAKVRGEQANTKLMLPMMMMLGVVMVLVMVPAFMSF